MLVFLNARANYGRAVSRWERVRAGLRERAGSFDVEGIESLEAVTASMRRAIDGGERAFIAAGGDGTVNLLLNATMSLENPSEVTLGAVGLGSSNDFHKPLREDSFICGVPVRVDCANAEMADVIRIDFADGDGGGTRYAAVNASLGITAESNARFNAPTAFVTVARRLSVDAAVVASVLTTLATYRDIGCRIVVDEADQGTFSVSNLGIIKNPHFAGSFCYDTPIEPDDGLLGINLCERLTPLQVLAALAALRRRRFSGRPKTRSWRGKRVSVEADVAFALEADGEIVRASCAEFSVLPRAIRCCR